MPRLLIDSLNEAIHRSTGKTCRVVHLTATGGGSISRALVAEAENAKWFVKINSIELLDMFKAEIDGLNALSKCREIRVPHVVAAGRADQEAYLVLEYLDILPLSDASAASAGRALAALHRITGNGFGWSRDNFIGSTPQSNQFHQDWPEFFARERLLPQLDLARRNGHPGTLIDNGERLSEKLHLFFSGYRTSPSLLHGDLWHGNTGLDRDGKLVLFDPAVYFGDREADLAMTELFGGFPAAFHATYRDAWPLAEGYPQRRTLYNLYHVLNHLNLFGSSYRPQAQHMISALLAEIG